MKTHWVLTLIVPLALPGISAGQDLDQVEQAVVAESVLEGAASAAERRAILLEGLGATNTEEGWLVSLPEEVLFDFDKTSLRASSQEKLDDVSDLYFLTGEPLMTVEGHADHIGNEDYNMELSDQRAKAVATWLIQEGRVDASKVTAAALGEQAPRARNEDPDGSDNPVGRQLNRRVDILLRHSGDRVLPPGAAVPVVPVETRVVVPVEGRRVISPAPGLAPGPALVDPSPRVRTTETRVVVPTTETRIVVPGETTVVPTGPGVSEVIPGSSNTVPGDNRVLVPAAQVVEPGVIPAEPPLIEAPAKPRILR